MMTKMELLAITKSTNPKSRSQHHGKLCAKHGGPRSSASTWPLSTSVAATCDGNDSIWAYCSSLPPAIRRRPHVQITMLYTIYIPALWCGSLGRKQISGSPDQQPVDRSERWPSKPAWPCNSIWGNQSSCFGMPATALQA
ncbi:hypothetical protein V8C35DRAFT_302510 [Trichoderma chlorosporum]